MRPRLAWAAGVALAAACMHEPVRFASSNGLAAAVATLELPPDAAVLVGSGDIADCETPAGAAATGELIGLVLQRAPDALVFTTGDHAYPDGAPEEFAACYAPRWGAFNAR